MIIDTIENLGLYAALNPLFSKVVEYIQHTDLNAQEPGKVQIQGTDLFVNYNTSKGKTPEQARIETHNKMIDIQIPLTCPKPWAIPLAPYCPQRSTTPRRTSRSTQDWPRPTSR